MKKSAQRKKSVKKNPKKQGSFSWRNFFQFFLIIPVIIFFIASPLFFIKQKAQAATGLNRVINFQGRVVKKTDSTNITDGTYSFTFKLYDAASAGNLLWQETQSSVTLTNGIFQVSLGSSTAFNAGGYNVDFKQNSLYLDITFNSETFGSRIQLASVPQAIDAEQLSGVVATQSATGFNLAGGTSTVSTVSFTTSGTTLTMQPGNTGALVINSNGASALTLDSGGAQQVNIGTTNANAISIGNNSGTNNTSITLTTGGTGNIILGSNTGLGNVQVNPNAGGQAALMVVDRGSGDILTASAAAITRFTVSNSGNITDTTGTVVNFSGAALTVASCTGCGGGGGSGSNFWTLSSANGDLYPINTTLDAFIGGTSTASAKFSVLNMTGSGTPIASISAGLSSAGGAYLSATGTLATTQMQGLVLGATTTGPISIGTDTTGRSLSLGNSSSTFALTSSGGLNVTTGGALTGVASIDTGGATGLTVGGTNATTVTIGGSNTTTYTFAQGNNSILNYNGTNFQIGNGSTATIQTTGGAADLNIRSAGTGNINIGQNAGVGNVLIAPNAGGKAALVVNKQSSSGDVFTASASGQTLFRITNNGSFMFQDSILVATGSGGVGNGSNAAENALGDEGSLVPNAGFESAITNAWGDGWFPAATTSAGLFTRDTATPAKGNGSLSVTLSNTTAAIYSVCMPVAGAASLGQYSLNYYVKASNATKMTISSFIDGYTSKANCQGDTSATVTLVKSALAGTSWGVTGSGTNAVSSFGASSTWARVHFLFNSSGPSITGELDGVRFIEKDGGQGLDYAENYPVSSYNVPQPGEVVSMDLNPNAPLAQVVPAYKDMDSNVLGVVSTNPGEVLDDGSILGPKVPVALAGRVPIKISTLNGPIAIGDYLTSSTIPGVAVKAISPGSTIGVAMQSYSGSDISSIVAFINRGYFPGTNNSGLAGQGVGLTSLVGTNSATMINLQVEDNKLVIKSSDGTNVISFDQNGNATFAGILTAKEIRADKISGIDILTNKISTLENQIASQSAVDPFATQSAILGIATESGALSLDTLTVEGLATVSGNFRVKGTGLFEGLLTILDTLSTHNVIVTGISDFFGKTNFHNDVTINGNVQVGKDTAGVAVISKGQASIHVAFDKSYANTPIITASLNLDEKTNPDGSVMNTDTVLQSILQQNYIYVISKISQQGFTISLNKSAADDLTFSWVALSADQSISPQPTSANFPTPTIMQINISSRSGLLTPEPTGSR